MSVHESPHSPALPLSPSLTRSPAHSVSPSLRPSFSPPLSHSSSARARIAPAFRDFPHKFLLIHKSDGRSSRAFHNNLHRYIFGGSFKLKRKSYVLCKPI